MNPVELKEFLLEKYELVCFVDLQDLQTEHRSVFHLFQKHYSPEFSPNQRLVFYSSHNPTQRLIDHIQRAAMSIDISRFFIMIVTPFDVNDKLIRANRKFDSDPTPIQSLILPITGSLVLSEPSKIGIIDTLCPVPFMQLDLTVTGAVKNCLYHDLVLGHISNKNLNNTFHQHPALVNLRSDLLSGIQNELCSLCWKNEKSVTNMREHILNKNIKELDFQYIDNPEPVSVHIAPTTQCNFQCRICNEEGSIRHAEEILEHSSDINEKNRVKKFLIRIDGTDELIYNNIEELYQSMQYLHIFGGEPFLWKQLPTLIDDLIERGHSKKIQIEFNTNGSIYHAKLLDKITKNFKSVEISLSIDDLYQRFELQRGGNWEKVHNNIMAYKNLRDQNSHLSVKLSPTVNIQNLLYLDELVKYCEQHTFDITWTYLYQPHFFCIDNVTQTVKDLVFAKYHNHYNSELRKISKRICSSPPVSGREFLNNVLKYDDYRNQIFKNSHAEIFNAMSQD